MTHPKMQDGSCSLIQRLMLELKCFNFRLSVEVPTTVEQLYLTSRADTRSSGPVNASEIGQFFFEISTFSRNVFSSTLGTSASVSSSINVIRGPSSKWTFALVRTCTGG